MRVVPPTPPEGVKVADLPADIQSNIRNALTSGAQLHGFLDLSLVELGPTFAVMAMPVSSATMNGSGNLHGGAVATLLDVPAGTAASRCETYDTYRHTLVTTNLHVRYVRTSSTPNVRARADVHAGKQAPLCVKTRPVVGF